MLTPDQEFAAALADPKGQWKPLPNLMCVSVEGRRTPERLMAVIQQFQVRTSARYQPRDGHTFCNIYGGDFARAMGAEIPHWVDAAGRPSSPGLKGARETLANELVEMLAKGAWGWNPCTSSSAHANAMLGRPVVAGWVNPDGPGHMAIVMPDRVFSLAQAGAICGEGLLVGRCFGTKPVAYFAHP